MNIETNGIADVILDLGGVLVDLDPESTIREFAALGFEGLEDKALIMSRYPFMEAYETGRIGTEEFIRAIQAAIPHKVSSERIRTAWNHLVMGLEKEVLQLVRRMRQKFRLSLLSNTNALHIESFNRKLQSEHGLKDLGEIFDRVFYSYELGMRKPDREIFEFVLSELDAEPPGTLYIDDSEEHVLSARKLGIRAHQLRPPEKLTGLLDISN